VTTVVGILSRPKPWPQISARVVRINWQLRQQSCML